MNPSDSKNAPDTLALAKLYESQGYLEDARKIYTALADEQPSEDVQAGLDRIREAQKGSTDSSGQGAEDISSRQRMAGLLEQWVTLMVLRQRLEKFKKIKSRLI